MNQSKSLDVDIPEEYASKEDTINKLVELGFTEVEAEHLGLTRVTKKGTRITQATVYRCMNGFWCVAVEGLWRSPIVWNGPDIGHGVPNQTECFVEFLNKQCPGWR